MVYSFDRPVGATGDVTELEYCSALHQTDAIGGIRKDFSIQGTDSLWCVTFVLYSRMYLASAAQFFLSSNQSQQMLILACFLPRDMASSCHPKR